MPAPIKNPQDEVVACKAQQHGNQRGVRVYIPRSVLEKSWKSGEIPDELFYRAIAWGKRTVLVRFGTEAGL